MGCLGEVFMEHYASEVNSAFLSAVVGMAPQVVRLLPSCSYSRGMTKILQLASENYVCRVGGAELDSQCNSKVAESKLSLHKCCKREWSSSRPFRRCLGSVIRDDVLLSVKKDFVRNTTSI
ncbi:uncharacterized protein LOC142791279 [Rhipicephalus microplus]|uniref:uncharacterized protein LOC142791279 n=1 Tax=Rhipicephalus microplus TaxID=6941 RepID=UPI003F6ABF42